VKEVGVKQSYARSLALLIFIGALFAGSAYSQVLYGTLVGTIVDQSGAVVPNATVTATNKDTGQVYTDKADPEGRYNIPNVVAGTYELKVTASGFRTLVQNDVLVSINNVTRVDVNLQVGQVSEQVTVEAQAVQLQTDKSDVHTEITAQAIHQLPLNRYRNYQQLINLVPGSTPASFQNSTTDTPGKALQTHINGANAQDNNTRLDGAQNINIWLPHHVAYVAPAETVETVNVATDAFDAEQGMAGGAAVTVVTKSGTNDLHGTGFAYYDNQHLKTRNFFQKPGTNKPFGDTNIDGGTIGGPIIKNRLFYFGGWERTRERNSAVSIVSVPTADQRAGDFSAYSTKIFDPLTGDPVTGVGRTQFPNNMIPANRITKQAQAVQALLPLPNNGASTTSNYFAAGTPVLGRNQYDIKVNFNRTDRHSIFGKYSLLDANVTAPPLLGPAVGGGIGGDPGVGHTFQQLTTLGHTWVVSPNIVIDGNVGYTRMSQYVKGTDYGKNYGTDVFGIPGTNGPDIKQSGIPQFDFNTYNSIGQTNSWMPLFRTDETYTSTHNVSWTHGAHEFRFGFDLIRYHLNHYQPELGGGPRGQFNFAGNTTVLGPNGSPTQFNSWASFLIGAPIEMQKSYQNILMTGREWQFGWYARDRWQVSRKLTVNLGLRYEFYPLMTRCCNKGLERYDPSTNLIYLGGRGNVPIDAGFSVSHKLFAPRLGIAYRLGENTVIRAGYGISYDPIPFSRPLRGFYPLTINTDYVGTTSVQPAGSLVTGIPAANFPDLSSGVITLDPLATERSPWGGEIHRGYIQSWNFTIEHRLPGNFVGSVAYVGTETVHNLADREYNAGYPGSGTNNLPLAKFGRKISTLLWDGYLSANYHSLQTSINKQFSHGLLIKGAYTWSKAIDFVDDDGWVTLARNYAPQFNWNRAPAGYDRTHVFQMGYFYELPFGKGKSYAGSGPVSYIIGNWQLAGSISAFTGTPFTVGASSSSLNAGPNNTQSADQVSATITKVYGVGPGQFFYDPSAWAPVTAVRFGNSGRNSVRGPGIFNTDIALSRAFPIKERFRIEFRTDCANLTNTPKFGNPTTSVSSGTFMQITNTLSSNSTAVPLERQFRFGLRLQF
jgi:Carboxypeptidase regulatory-like domain/TonB dependent receptor